MAARMAAARQHISSNNKHQQQQHHIIVSRRMVAAYVAAYGGSNNQHDMAYRGNNGMAGGWRQSLSVTHAQPRRKWLSYQRISSRITRKYQRKRQLKKRSGIMAS